MSQIGIYHQKGKGRFRAEVKSQLAIWEARGPLLVPRRALGNIQLRCSQYGGVGLKARKGVSGCVG